MPALAAQREIGLPKLSLAWGAHSGRPSWGHSLPRGAAEAPLSQRHRRADPPAGPARKASPASLLCLEPIRSIWMQLCCIQGGFQPKETDVKSIGIKSVDVVGDPVALIQGLALRASELEAHVGTFELGSAD